MMKPVQRVLIFAAATAAVVAASANAGLPPVPDTIPLIRLAADPEAWRGQEVRTCGPRFRGDLATGVWQLSRPSAVGYHPAIVRVVACPGVAPPRDSEGCVSGRIARRDGSIEPTAEGADVTVSSDIINYAWFLHAQCPAPRRN